MKIIYNTTTGNILTYAVGEQDPELLRNNYPGSAIADIEYDKDPRNLIFLDYTYNVDTGELIQGVNL